MSWLDNVNVIYRHLFGVYWWAAGFSQGVRRRFLCMVTILTALNGIDLRQQRDCVITENCLLQGMKTGAVHH